MKEIPLTRGYVALVDDADFEWLSKGYWWAEVDKSGGVHARGYMPETGKKRLRMHRLILGLTFGLADHEDGNGINNQRYNLRPCTHAENSRNAKLPRNNKSGFRGVCWNRDARKWVSQIHCGGRVFCLGYFLDSVIAAQAYDVKAKELFGAFARLNFSQTSGE